MKRAFPPALLERQGGMRRAMFASGVFMVAGCSLTMPGLALAQSAPPASGSDLSAENARLRDELLQVEQERDRLKAQVQGQQPPKGEGAPPDAATAAPVTNAAASANAASQANAAQDSADTLGAVVVTARNRAEKLQDVPIPVSAVSGKTLDQDGAVTFADFAKHAAGIIVSPQNARQSSISMRGLGKQGATDAMESSVGIIVDDVFLAYGAYSWANYVDLDQVEVLRGPQGTLLGKNTTLGVVNVSTKLPSFMPEFTFESTIGTRHTFIEQASATGPLIDGVLAYRASVSAENANGAVTNAYPDDSTYTNSNRIGGRLQLLFTPTSAFSARIILNHQYSNEYDNGGSILVTDPTTLANGTSRTAGGAQTFTSRLGRSWFGGYQPTYGGNQVNLNAQQPVKNQQDGLSAELKWNLGEYTLTSITAYDRYNFIARNDNDDTPFNIAYNYNTDATQWQASQELRLNSPVGGPIDYQVGLYALRESIQTNSKAEFGTDAGAFYASNSQYASLNATAAGRQLMSDSLNNVYTRQTQWPTTTSLAAYGQANWHLTDKATITAGVRETDEERNNNLEKVLVNGGSALAANDATAQKYFGVSTYSALTAAQQSQIANAVAIRNGQIGQLYGFSQGQGIHQLSTSWLLSPSYKLTDDILLYASASYGQKSGVVLFNTSNGAPQNANPEKALDFELGFKSALLNHSLIFNANLYQTNIHGYQQLLQVLDPTQASGYRNVTGNADEVQLRGLEIDSAYTGLKHFVFTLAGAYGSAIYKSFDNATCPAEISAPVCNFSGKQLPGASKLTLNFGAEFTHPVFDGYLFHSNVNVSYRSGTNLDTTLSEYGWQKAYTLTDIGFGIGPTNGRYDVSLIVKNLFNVRYALAKTTFTSTAPVTELLGDPRFVGVVLRAKFD
ncbi:TonB-dependent receptor [Caballeronia sp. 15711]|uniref:TonB-dependent receptor n=1 Tax=Caballeronia sp. 15711 TaxID=3391029 RepID=UPI0039E28830